MDYEEFFKAATGTVIAEVPRIQPYSQAIRGSIAATLMLDIDQISVKATTNEHMGFIGRGEGIAALAIASVARCGDEVVS